MVDSAIESIPSELKWTFESSLRSIPGEVHKVQWTFESSLECQQSAHGPIQPRTPSLRWVRDFEVKNSVEPSIIKNYVHSSHRSLPKV